jgi:hypothetical protein
MEDFIVQIGNNVIIKVIEYQGKKYIDIRKYYQKEGEWLPTKKGIALSPDVWEEFVGKIGEIDSKAKEML